MRFFVWIALTLGRPIARLLLYPISLYFLCFSSKARNASWQYLGRVLERTPRLTDLFRHFHTFAATILDRVYLLNDQFDSFDVHVHGVDRVDSLVARGEGCFLLGAHLGSFEVLRSLGREQPGLQVSLVMYEDNARKLNAVLKAINPASSLRIIALGKVNSMLKVEEALNGGACVGILSDRTIAGEGTMTCDFLGEAAQFPLGPFRLAAMLRRPVVLMFGIYRGGNRYDVYFEELAGMHQLDRKERQAMIEAALRRYVTRLEYYCRLQPYNWFNFYDFWE